MLRAPTDDVRQNSRPSKTVTNAIHAMQALALDPSVADEIAELAWQTGRALERLLRGMPQHKSEAPVMLDAAKPAPSAKDAKTRKRRQPNADTASGMLAEDLRGRLPDKDRLTQDEVFKLTRLKRNASSRIELGRAMTMLGFRSKRVGKAKNRQMVYFRL